MRAFIAVQVGLLKTTVAALLLPAFSLHALANPSELNNVAAHWNFNAGDEAFAAANSAGVEGPWTYDPTIGAGGTGGWFANGSGGVGSPTSTILTTPTVTIPESGAVTLNFDHRYSFEYDGTRYDGGNVRMSVNGAPFVLVENSRFTANGYPGVITGHNIISDQEGFSADSPGYTTSAFIRSVAQLGDFQAGDTIAIQFAAGWDELALASSPSWVIDNVSILVAPARPITVFPSAFGFEPEEGYVLGGLNAQKGWTVDNGQAEVWTQTVYSGAQAARIAPGGQISHRFVTGCPIVTFSAYLQASPSSAPEIPLLAQAAVLYLDPTYGLTGLDGDGNGSGNWVGSGVVIPAGTWFQVTLELNFDRKSWECAVNGRPALSGLHFHSDSLTAFASLTASAGDGDTLLDEARVSAASAPLPSSLDPIAQFPFGLGFETHEGYLAGDLDAQNGWTVDNGQAEVWTRTVYSGAQAARIAPGGQISHDFAAGCPIVTFTAYLQASPSSAPEIPLLAQAAVLYLDPTYGLTGLDGDGNGSGNWVGSGVAIPPGTWFQLSLKLDFDQKSWECAVNGRPALAGLHFHSDNVTTFASLAVAASTGDTLLDDGRVTVESAPLPSELDPISMFPFSLGFEPEEGYLLGDLDEQNGWTVDSGEAEVWNQTVYSGAQAARIAPGGQISHEFAAGCPIVTFTAFMQASPTSSPEIPLLAQAAVLHLDPTYGLTGLDGDGRGGGHWVGSGVVIPAGTWFQLTLKLDFDRKSWECAVNGRPALAGLHFHSDNVVAFASLAAAASGGDTLLDAARVTVEDAAPPREISLLPSRFGFEPEEGYRLGSLNHQNGWSVESGEAEVWSKRVYSGVQAARIGPGGQIAHDFATACPIVTFDAYLQATPSAAPEIPDTAQIAVLYLDAAGGITGLDGDGNGGGKWVSSGVTVPSDAWFQATIRLDFVSKSWSCAVNGKPVLSQLHFHADSISSFASFTASADPKGVTLLDQITFLAENGSFSLPTLTIVLSGTAVEVSWPADVGGYRLQATASLANPGWADVVTSGNHVSEHIDQTSRFYRLIAP